MALLFDYKKRGGRLETNYCKVRQKNNGQFEVTIPANIARVWELKKGAIIKFDRQGDWIKIEKPKI